MIFKLLLFLLAIGGGAIINVAVAWGCAAWLGFDANKNRKDADIVGGYSAMRWTETGVDVFNSAATPPDGRWAVRAREQFVPNWLPESQSMESVLVDGRGWPFISMYCTRHPERRFCISFHGNPWFIWGTPMERLLPLRPAMPGFAINTIFYAAIVWVLSAVPGAVRRRVRIKRGQCASCGYSLRESVSEKCPECGTTV